MPSSTTYIGWGSTAWGQGSWGTDLIVVEVDGVQATGAVGTVTAVAEAIVSPTGVEATGALGTVSVSGASTVQPSGLEATTGLGTVTVIQEAVVLPTGVEATGATGTVTVAADAIVSPTGVEAVGATTVNYDGPAFTADGAAQLSTAQAKFGSASLLLDGTDDFVTSDENIDLSSGDFTVDMWIRPTSVTGYKGLWQSGTSSLLNVYLIGDQVQGVVGGSTTLFLSSTRISANVWTMISVEREGNVHRLYINGTLEQSSSTANRPDNGVFSVGKNGFGDFNGYIDEVRLSTSARYTGSSFTEPTAAFIVDSPVTALLHFDGANGATDIINARNVNVTTVEADAIIDITGVQGSATIADVTITADASLDVTGVAANTAVGDEGVDAEAIVTETGLGATTAIGSITVTADATITPTGVVAAGELGIAFVWGEIDDAQTPSWVDVDDSQSTTWTLVDDGNTVTWVEIET